MTEYYSISDTGLYREKNQDSLLTLFNANGDFIALVCDGIGGGLAGDVASKSVCDTFKELFESAGSFENINDLKIFVSDSILEANNRVVSKSLESKEYYGMGTTLTGIILSHAGNILFNCGDSRVYGYSDKLVQLTYDDTLVNRMIKNGEITEKEALTHPKRHYLTRAIGVFSSIEYTVKELPEYEYYLLCSDGLSGFVSEKEISEVLSLDETVKEKCEGLLSLALLKGGYDNITAVIVKHV